MTTPTLKGVTLARAHATGDAGAVVTSLVETLKSGLGQQKAGTVLFFASSSYTPTDLAGPLTAAFPGVPVLGCSTSGEFTDAVTGTGGVSAVALPEGVVARVGVALGQLGEDRDRIAAGCDAAVAGVEKQLGVPLRSLDPATHLGFVLIDGMHGSEEVVNERLGNAAPLLDVVGGSAGDDLAFDKTWVSVGEEISYNGVALAVIESAVPFKIVKTCSFRPSGKVLRITKADVPNRTVLEFDGRPAVEAYAAAVGVEPGQVDASVFMAHPVGLMIDGEPWIRSPQMSTPEGHLKFYAQILEGMEVEVMDSGDLVAETGAAITAAREALGGSVSGGVMFNCILRRLEIDAKSISEPFLGSFGKIPLAGFHTYGETWLGHVNQTLTGVVFG